MSHEYVLRPFRPAVDLHIDYPNALNPQQLEAVTAPPGPALVLAGAGAGKTRVLTYRVAFLLEQGIPPDRILLLTFTNKAAREMMQRVGDLLGGDLSGLWGGTFHAVGHRLLRRHADRVGYPGDFTILDRDDATDLIQACLDDATIRTTARGFPKPDVIGELFSLATNTGRTLAELLQGDLEHFAAFEPDLARLQHLYQARKRTTGGVDFDDLLTLWRRLLDEHADLRELYQRRFEFLLVDEYQDTNRLQSDLIDLLAARRGNVMAVGDDSQSIYSWRGANYRNILDFPQRHPGTRVFRIETNYRSTPEILALANAAIAANTQQFAKNLVPVRRPGAKPILVVCQTAAEQAAFVAQRVLELHEEGTALNSMAVLYRSHFHALELQLELTRRHIPFSITSGLRFFEQAHVKDVAAYLRLLCNPRDELAFKRLARLFPGIGRRTADKLWTLFRASPAAPDVPLAQALQRCARGVPAKAAVAWAQSTATLAQADNPESRAEPARLIRHVVEADYADHLKARYTRHQSRLEDLNQLALFAAQFRSAEEFLAQLALLTSLETDQDRPADSDENPLRLSTIHQAKGLEFDVVFIIMLCEGLFPSARSLETLEAEEEERRLFYVAVTRARNELYLSYPLVRSIGTRNHDFLQRPSRFLDEIPNPLREEWNLRAFGRDASG